MRNSDDVSRNWLLSRGIAGSITWSQGRPWRSIAPLRLSLRGKSGTLCRSSPGRLWAVELQSGFHCLPPPRAAAPAGAGWLDSVIFSALTGVWMPVSSMPAVVRCQLLRHLQRRLDARVYSMLAGLTSPATSEETVLIVKSVLQPGLTKGDEEVTRTRLPASAVGIRVVLTLGQSSPSMSYRASISAPDGAFPLWAQAGLIASRRGPTDVVILLVPADLFTGTDYICHLERSRDGVHFEALTSYRLAVSRESTP